MIRKHEVVVTWLVPQQKTEIIYAGSNEQALEIAKVKFEEENLSSCKFVDAIISKGRAGCGINEDL